MNLKADRRLELGGLFFDNLLDRLDGFRQPRGFVAVDRCDGHCCEEAENTTASPKFSYTVDDTGFPGLLTARHKLE
jgi:hypothetical protein